MSNNYSDLNVDDCVTPIRCTVMRGGTSRAVFFRERDLPDDPDERDQTILSVMGSPHPRQIDGLGGADILTSKIAIVSEATDDERDVSYKFGQVSITDPRVDYDVNCGNISSAVGHFAINEGLVEPTEPKTVVRIRNENSGLLLTNEVPTTDGIPEVDGDFSIRGVPGTGAKVNVGFVSPGGETTGEGLLPTGSSRDEVTVEDRTVRATYVDAGNPCVFVPAEDLGCTGTELPDEIDTDDAMLEKIETIRVQFAVESGLAADAREAREEKTVLPLVVLVGEPTDYDDYEGNHVHADEISLVARLVADGTLHKAYAGTGAVCTAVASQIDGSVVADFATTRRDVGDRETLTIGHPSGTMDALLEIDGEEVEQVLFSRTARRLMDGTAYARPEMP